MPYSPVSAATVLVASVALLAPGAAQAKSPKRAPSAAPVHAQPAPVRAPAQHRPSRASSAGRRIR
jgi:hypothetical protein